MRLGLIVLLLAAVVSGCAHSRSAEEQASALYIPDVPAFLSGPMGVLLTNAGGFSSQVAMTTGSASPAQRLEVISGQLLGRGDQLLFAPDQQSLEKRLRSIGLSYIWNVKDNRGFVLSETLQGWAPIGFGVHYTNVLATRTDTVPESVAGHPCIQESVQITSNESAVSRLQVWRATDLKGRAVRITAGTSSAPQTLTLSKVRLQAPPADLFAPPDSFTRYENPDLMMSELTLRQHNLKKHPSEEWNERELAPNSPYQRPR
jgi:hypothetical protein